MKQTNGVNAAPRRSTQSEQEIFSAIEQYEVAGNISVKEFAAAFQISEATFYNWRKRYRAKERMKNQIGGFIPVDTSAMQLGEPKGQIFAEFRGIVFYQQVDPAYLKALL
jgi:hypothetical protein